MTIPLKCGPPGDCVVYFICYFVDVVPGRLEGIVYQFILQRNNFSYIGHDSFGSPLSKVDPCFLTCYTNVHVTLLAIYLTKCCFLSFLALVADSTTKGDNFS